MIKRHALARSVPLALAVAAALGPFGALAQARRDFADFAERRLELAQTALSACDSSQPADQKPGEPVRLAIGYDGRGVSVDTVTPGIAASTSRGLS